MIRIDVEVGSGGGIFKAAVRADSIARAVGLARTRYPGSDVRVLFPIDPEDFFCEDSTPATVPIRPEMPEEEAGGAREQAPYKGPGEIRDVHAPFAPDAPPDHLLHR